MITIVYLVAGVILMLLIVKCGEMLANWRGEREWERQRTLRARRRT